MNPVDKKALEMYQKELQKLKKSAETKLQKKRTKGQTLLDELELKTQQDIDDAYGYGFITKDQAEKASIELDGLMEQDPVIVKLIDMIDYDLRNIAREFKEVG